MKRLIILLLVVGCDVIDPDVRGCTDTTACNFNADANIFDGSCRYFETINSYTEGTCDGSCNEGFVELWGLCYSIERTTHLYLSSNNLTGSIPPEIGNLTNLTKIQLGYNELTGSIPPEIGNLTNLTQLTLRNNQLTGEIPSSIGNLTNLWSLWLKSNLLTGSIPESICNLKDNISVCFLSENKICGEIPSCVTTTCVIGEQDCP